ncbi:MAG: glycosyltransferase family 4 protein [Actinomycetia bacterium]|nr:glycosyltransferase family 4 protein [Actinomycetes bacterium]
MRRWAAAGLEVVHRTSTAPGLPATAQRNGYSVVRRGSRYSVFPRTMVAELAHRMGPFDALIEIWNGVPWLSPLWCRRPNITVVHHVHDQMWEQMFPRPVAAVCRVIETKIAPLAYRRTMVVSGSESTTAHLRELGYRAERTRVVPYGVAAAYSPGGERSSYPLVLSVGRLAPVKEHDLLIAAALQAKERVPALRLVIVGSGPRRAALEQLIAAHDASDWITMPGRIALDELIALYRQAWLVASASRSEGWGLTLTEAAACGTPAVATDIAGHQCSVIDGVTGVLAPIELLGERIGDLLLDEKLRTTLGAQALSRARGLSWDSAASGLLAALRDEVRRRVNR